MAVQDFDSFQNDARISNFLRSQFLRGNYHPLTQENGHWGVSIGGRFFTNPLDLTHFKRSTGFRREDIISTSPKDRAGRLLESKLGPQRYFELEALMQKASQSDPRYKGIRIFRESYGVQEGGTKGLADMLTRNGEHIGFLIPDDEATTVLRVVGAGGKDFTTREIEEMMGKVGYTIFGERMGTGAADRAIGALAGGSEVKDLAKLMKRLKVVGNIEMFGLQQNNAFKAAVLSESQAKNLYAGLLAESGSSVGDIFKALGVTGKEADSMFEGFSLLNPMVVRRAMSQMSVDLEATERYLEAELKAGRLTRESDNLKAIEMTISKKKEELKEMDELLARGGRLQDFRMRGFDENYLMSHAQALGFDTANPEDMKRLESLATSMIKGDVGVMAEKEWYQRLPTLSKYLGFNAADMDVLAYAGNFASQFGLAVGSGGSLTFKPTTVKAFSRVDPQFLSSFPEIFGGVGDGQIAGFQSLSEYNQGIFKNWMQGLADPSTSQIPKTYREMLERLVGIGEQKTDSDIKYLTQLFGSKNALELDEAFRQQKQKAINILAMERAGFTPATNRQMFKEVGEGLIDFMQKSQARPDELFGFTPMSGQAHVTSDFWAKMMGIKTAGPGQATFDPKIGLIYNGVDAHGLMEIHGGGDFDDLIQMMLRWDPKNKTFMFVNRRSPGGLGEILGIETSEDSVLKFGKMLMKDSDLNYKLRASFISEADKQLEKNTALRASLGSRIVDMDSPEDYLKKWIQQSESDLRQMKDNLKVHEATLDGWASRERFLKGIKTKIEQGRRVNSNEVDKLKRMLVDVPGGKSLTEEADLIRELLWQTTNRSSGKGFPGLATSYSRYTGAVRSATARDIRGRKSLPTHIGAIEQDLEQVKELRSILTGAASDATGWDQSMLHAVAASVPELDSKSLDELLRQGVYYRGGQVYGAQHVSGFLKTLTDQQLKFMSDSHYLEVALNPALDPTVHITPEITRAAQAFKINMDKEDQLLAEYGGAINIPEMKKLEDILSPQTLSGMTPLSRETYERLARAEQTKHALGSYAMLREWVDQIERQVQDQGIHISGSAMPFKNETVIDLLVQGAYKDFDLSPDAVTKRTYAMLASISDMVINDGLQLDPARLHGLRAAGLHHTLMTMLESKGVDTSSIAADTGEDMASIMTRASKMQRENRRKYRGLFDDSFAQVPEYEFIDRHFFGERALSDAQTLSEAFNSGWDSAKAGVGVFSPSDQIQLFGEIIDPEMDSAMVDSARTEMRKALAGLFEQDSSGKMIMGNRAKEAMGAFMQKFGTAGTRESRALLGQELSDATMQTLIHFAKIHPNSDSARLLAKMDMKSARPITQDQMLHGIEGFAPGSKQQALGARAYGYAKDVIEGIKGPQGWKALGEGGMFATLMEKPLFKRGAIAAGLLVGGSVLYRKLTDRTPEDMQGPPMLPGGGFYEDMPQVPAPQVGNRYIPPNRGGVTYKVNARGNFDPHKLAQQAGIVSGGSVTGSTFSAPSHGFKKKSPFDALSSGGF